jgi:hypothetical protein
VFTRKNIHNDAGDDRVKDLDVEDPKMDRGGALFLWISFLYSTLYVFISHVFKKVVPFDETKAAV